MDFNNKITGQRFYRAFFWYILALSIILRLPYICVERLWPDEALYAWNAQRIFHHPELIFSKEMTDFHPPLFSVLLSLGHFFFPPQLACHAMVFFTNILGLIVIYFLGKKIQGYFLGCFAAMMLSFNFMYFMFSGHVLIDGVLAVAMIAFFYSLTAIVQRNLTRNDFYLGLIVMALILLKWSGVLILPLIILYYWLAFPEWTVRERLTKASVPLMFGIVLIGLLLGYNYVIWGNWVPKVFSTSNAAYQQPFFYYFDQFRYIIDRLLILFFILGFWFTYRSGDRNYWVHSLWTVLALLVMSAMPNKDVRFMLPLIPSVVLMTGITLHVLLSRLEKATAIYLFKPLALILIFGFILVFDYPKIDKFMTRNAHTYVGFQAAGVYIKEAVRREPDTLVLAGSPRVIRYFSGINFKEFGGNLSKIPESESEFAGIVQETSSEIILVVDKWEWMQPKWIRPFNDENLKFLNDLGFHLERVVYKDVFVSKDKIDKVPVVWSFRREAKNR